MSRSKTSAAKELASTTKTNSKPAIRKGGNIEPPSHLNKAQLQIWDKLVSSIDTTTLLEIDSLPLSRYVTYIEVYNRMIKDSSGEEVEPFVQGEQAFNRINPRFDLALKLEKHIAAFEKEFGFNLRSRLQMAEAFAEEEKEHDPMTEFFTR